MRHTHTEGDIHSMVLDTMGGDTINLWALEQTTAERWGGLSGFAAAYAGGEAEFSCLCLDDSAFADGIDLGFAWGLLTAVSNLAGVDMETVLHAAHELLESE